VKRIGARGPRFGEQRAFATLHPFSISRNATSATQKSIVYTNATVKIHTPHTCTHTHWGTIHTRFARRLRYVVPSTRAGPPSLQVCKDGRLAAPHVAAERARKRRDRIALAPIVARSSPGEDRQGVHAATGARKPRTRPTAFRSWWRPSPTFVVGRAVPPDHEPPAVDWRIRMRRRHATSEPKSVQFHATRAVS
jgi:hypothetical protein